MTADALSVISVVVVDDEPSVLRSWKEILRDPRYRVSLFGDPAEAEAAIHREPCDVAVLDLRMPAMDGLTLLSRIKRSHRDIEVLMMTGYGGIQEAVDATKRGAYGFLTKPFESIDAAENAVRRAAERRILERRVHALEQRMQETRVPVIFGRSVGIRRVNTLVETVAPTSATVLICGESGTGKEIVARALHGQSSRRERPMVAVNCSALSETLLESELFGYVRGAFTGAVSDRQGLFEAGHSSSLFLDEIGDMPLSMQAKVLRVLQDGEVRPVGSTHTIKVDVRVIAATNVDLEARCREGTFRSDLYYRLNVVRVDMPPLRERGEDIQLLAYHFLRKAEATAGKELQGLEPEAARCLQEYSWPGNVRELENVMERAAILGKGPLIGLGDLPTSLTGQPEVSAGATSAPGDLLAHLPFAEAKAVAVERFERSYLRRLLDQNGSVAAAARAAGLDRANFRRLLRRHGLQSVGQTAPGQGNR
jgi:DNA-binding NtrC family response regulator